jgi:photosystem II stability/assembly factor-like uncharacterized protein
MKSTITFILLLAAFGLFAQTFTWTEQQSGVNTTLNDVFFADALSGWVVGAGGVILHTSDGGDSWAPQASGTSERLDAVHFIDATTGWAVGSQNTAIILKTTDGGNNWDELPNNFQSTQIRDVFFANANTGWITFRDSIFYSTDGGTSWDLDEYTTGVEGPLNNWEIFATSDTMAFIAGKRKNNGSNVGAVFDRRPDNSDLWGFDGVSAFGSGDFLRSINFASNTLGFAGDENGKVYRMQSDGINFNGPWDLSIDVGAGLIYAISFPTSDKGMFLSAATVNSVNYGIVHHTTDAGDNWTTPPDSIAGILPRKLHAPVGDNAWLVGSFGKIFKGNRLPVSTDDFENLVGLEVFPNPFDNNITVNISLDQPENLIIKLSNINGQKVYENSFDLGQGETSFELENLNKLGSGIYFLNLYSEKGNFLASKKVVKF